MHEHIGTIPRNPFSDPTAPFGRFFVWEVAIFGRSPSQGDGRTICLFF